MEQWGVGEAMWGLPLGTPVDPPGMPASWKLHSMNPTPSRTGGPSSLCRQKPWPGCLDQPLGMEAMRGSLWLLITSPSPPTPVQMRKGKGAPPLRIQELPSPCSCSQWLPCLSLCFPLLLSTVCSPSPGVASRGPPEEEGAAFLPANQQTFTGLRQGDRRQTQGVGSSHGCE